MPLNQHSNDELLALRQQVQSRYNSLKSEGLQLDLTRGKPSSAQLDLSNGLDGILQANYMAGAVDTRNYGSPLGIAEARALGAELLGVPADQVLAGGNASLTLMFFAVMLQNNIGCRGSDSAWNRRAAAKVICPVPGYDRHFTICETLGVDMVTVPMTDSGPDRDAVETLIKNDPDVVGLWCVPKYSNPTGCTYSDETVDRIAALGKTADPSFRVFWDNAYAEHHIATPGETLASIYDACMRHGTEDSVWQFASTSKMTFAGAGISWAASSAGNLATFKKFVNAAIIGFDHVNQLRHVKMFPNLETLREHMEKHRQLIAPKFEAVLRQLDEDLDADYGEWTRPAGGYFISFDAQPGLAQRIVDLAGEVGVKLTPAGATFPYGKDPQNRNIRLAPSLPPLEEVQKAAQVFTLCVQLATLEQKLAS